MRNISVVSFDGDDTLWDFSRVMRHSLAIALRELKRRLPGPSAESMTVETLREIRDSVASEQNNEPVNLERVRFLAFKRTVQLAGGDPNGTLPGELNDLYLTHRFEDLELYPDVIPCLDSLERRFTLALLSNGNSYPDRIGLDGRFSVVAFAQDLGVAKPDPAFFERAFHDTDYQVGEVMHVGDSLRSDVGGANDSGCVSVWLNRKSLKNETEHRPDYEITTLAELRDLLL